MFLCIITTADDVFLNAQRTGDRLKKKKEKLQRYKTAFTLIKITFMQRFIWGKKDNSKKSVGMSFML